MLVLFSTCFMATQLLSRLCKPAWQPPTRQPVNAGPTSEVHTQMQLGLALRERSLSFWQIAFASTLNRESICLKWRRSRIAVTGYDAMGQTGQFYYLPNTGRSLGGHGCFMRCKVAHVIPAKTAQQRRREPPTHLIAYLLWPRLRVLGQQNGRQQKKKFTPH